MLGQLKKDVRKLADPEKAKIYQSFFKTGPGEYGESDKFLGLTVPQSRSIAKKNRALSLEQIQQLLHSKFHEDRLIALLILVGQFQSADRRDKKQIYNFYLANTKFINNWDLVDLSAHKIVGPYLQDKPKDILKKLAKANSLWERRIAILSTFHYINQGNPELALEIAKILLGDKHDLIHKAVGWMLREIGKRCSEKILTDFLDKHAATMPRTTLRYSIERLTMKKRKYYLNFEQF